MYRRNICMHFSVTPTIQEAIEAISVLERTVQDVHVDEQLLTVTVDDVTYSIVMATLTVTSLTHCGEGLVAVEAVCGKSFSYSYTMSFIQYFLKFRTYPT